MINLIGHKHIKKERKEKEETANKDLKQAKIEELTELVKRIQAEFENFKKREEKDRKHFAEFSNAELIKSLLPILDSIDSAEKNGNPETIKGLELIKKQLTEVLEKYGLKEINSLGKKFNPEFHECLLKENNSEKQDEIILEEFQKGFMLNDKVLRHSKVKINSIESEKNE